MYLTSPCRQIHKIVRVKFARSCHIALERTSCNQQHSNQQQAQMILSAALCFLKIVFFKELAFQYLIKQTLNFKWQFIDLYSYYLKIH